MTEKNYHELVYRMFLPEMREMETQGVFRERERENTAFAI